MRQYVRRIVDGGLHMLLRRYRVIQIGVLTAGALVSLAVVILLLFGSVSAEPAASTPTAQLKTDIVDELELFIELRNTAYENPPIVSLQVFGR